MRIRRALRSLALVASFCSLSSGASAQAQPAAEGFNANRFEPSERGSHWFALDSLDFRGNARPAIGVVGDYARRPLPVYDAAGNLQASVVAHMLTTHVGGSLVLGEAVRFAVDMPLVPYIEGEETISRGSYVSPPRDASAVGDLRFAFDVKLFGQGDEPIAAAIGAQGFAPTGDRANYSGDKTFRISPHLLIAGTAGVFTYALKGGAMIRGYDIRDFADAAIGHEIVYGASAGIRVADRRLVIGPEVFGSTTMLEHQFAKRTTPVEGLLGLHFAFKGGLRLGAGGGAGLTRGLGSPAFRALALLEYAPEVPNDTDGDGITDDEDACVRTPGVRSADPAKNGCPKEAPVTPSDRDHDGIVDRDDACPDVRGMRSDDPRTNGCADQDGDLIADPIDACPEIAGPASDDPKVNGCPDLDRDKDEVPNSEDACPDVAGIKTSDPKTNGCPDPDRDKDGIPNDQDACPDEAGKADADPKKNGCPKAFVSQGQIRILDQVKFKPGSADILPGKDSEEVLQAVAKVLRDHPEIAKLRVEGHTDNTGTAKINTKLSGDRAASVVKWLVKNGIDKSRLTSQGFGPDRPIDTNTTEQGRRNNRRVEFHIEPSSANP